MSGAADPAWKNIKFDSAELRGAEQEYYSNMHAINERLTRVEERTNSTVDILRGLAPKIDEVHAFTVHKLPHLATKEDVSTVKIEVGAEISKRPTTSLLLTITALLLAFLALPFCADWWMHVTSSTGVVVRLFSRS